MRPGRQRRERQQKIKFLSNKLRTFIEARKGCKGWNGWKGFLSNKLRTFIEAKPTTNLLTLAKPIPEQ